MSKRIYAVTDRAWLNGKTLGWAVSEAIKGGAEIIQLREKNLPFEEFLKEANELRALCKKNGVKFIVNDNVEVAKLCGADGVHVGQEDLKNSSVREIKEYLCGAEVGVSANTVELALDAEREGADLIGVGAMFQTGTKADAESVSMETLERICGAVKIPVYAIGGINRENIGVFANSGVAGAAVVSAIFAAEDMRAATAELKKLIGGEV